ncbi:hypothetical protein SAMN05216327_109289 [Dyadobacter sp. SG02]|uniref:hypothetical protein n=1 Tax=Dyadobacter sp. SG02 TaxID=1855291 RepID=UPI0008C872FF|nr:hypothetical protein [Dyadobacter sp. SG02]SEJ40501.1 hypothetical protein SAMN05216327_109289 [Dyadobacter sp. SG02]
MKNQKIAFFTAVIVFSFCIRTFGQEHTAPASFPYSNRFTLGGGVSQILLGGFNVQAEYTTKRFVFDYSHGFNLHFKGNAASLVAQRQQLQEKLTHTLGFGVGYRITPRFDIRFEPKIHFYEVNYNGDAAGPQPLKSYHTVTLGAGAYYRYYPFEHQKNVLAGILIMPSVRYWPNVSSSLDDNSFTYFNKITDKLETYKAAPQGFPATKGLLANITIAYTFGMNK